MTAPQRLDFEDEGHVYSVGGAVLSSVTQILKAEGWSKDWSFLDPWYAERGRIVHHDAARDLLGILDRETVDPIVRPFLENLWIKLERIGFEPLVVEQRMYHPALWYAGTGDTLGTSTEDERRVILDYKATTNEAASAVQAAGGYLPLFELYARHDLIPVTIDELADCRVGIAVLDNPGPIEWVEDVRLQRQYFRAALTSYQWKARHVKGSRQ